MRPLVLPLMLLAALAGCAGYQIGNESLYPCHIRTVYVPMFETNSFRRNFGERLTEAVMKEIELKTPYKIVATPDADSILSGRVVSETKRNVLGSPIGNPRRIETSLAVMVNWVDRSGNALRPEAAIPLDPGISVLGMADVVPEVGQSIATGQQQAIDRTAKQIVGLMEAPW